MKEAWASKSISGSSYSATVKYTTRGLAPFEPFLPPVAVVAVVVPVIAVGDLPPLPVLLPGCFGQT